MLFVLSLHGQPTWALESRPVPTPKSGELQIVADSLESAGPDHIFHSTGKVKVTIGGQNAYLFADSVDISLDRMLIDARGAVRIVRNGVLTTGSRFKFLADSRDYLVPRDMSLFEVTPETQEADISLTAYVTRRLEPVAERIEDGKYNEALELVDGNEIQLNEVFQTIESRYLKGICLQALSKFDEAKVEFDWVKQNTERSVLQEKAEIGREAAIAKCESIRPDQIRFPAHGFVPDMRMERRPIK